MARYFLRFRHSDTGLTPSFSFFKKASDLSVVSPAPPIVEVGSGTYDFDYSPTFDIVFEVDGGVSIPTEEVRYISDTIGPRDGYIDEPTSQVRTDVWADNTSYSVGQKGKRVDQLGDPTDASAAATMFGKELLYTERIRGDSAGLTDGNNEKQIYDRIGAPTLGATIAAGVQQVDTDVIAVSTKLGTPAGASVSADIAAISAGALTGPQVAAAVLDTLMSSHVGAGTVGAKINQSAAVADVTAARDNIKGASLIDLTNIAGTGFVSATHGLKATSDGLVRALGMLHENSVLDLTSFDGNNNLQQARLRLYDSAANATAATAASPGVYNTGKIAEYVIQATYTGSNLLTYEVSKV